MTAIDRNNAKEMCSVSIATVAQCSHCYSTMISFFDTNLYVFKFGLSINNTFALCKLFTSAFKLDPFRDYLFHLHWHLL